jgi:hypothetical protein
MEATTKGKHKKNYKSGKTVRHSATSDSTGTECSLVAHVRCKHNAPVRPLAAHRWHEQVARAC